MMTMVRTLGALFIAFALAFGFTLPALAAVAVTVNGTPITPGYASSPLAAWSAGKPGTLVRLRLCDGTERTLTLSRFY